MHCLITDRPVQESNNGVFSSVGTDVFTGPLAERIRSKYNNDELRWACKPLMLLWLLNKGYEKVIYVDNDIYFYSSPDFIFDLLEEHAVLLTPHYYKTDTKEEQYWLEGNFRLGMCNAGFVGVNDKGRNAAEWWAECCAYNVRKSSWRGLFDDQKYLDMLPVLFEDVHILKHLGCNVAFWNFWQRSASVNSNGELILNEEFPLVFVHYTKGTMRTLLKEKGHLLHPLFKAYEKTLKQFNPTFNISYLTKHAFGEGLDYVRHLIWLTVRMFER